ncbi:MAG: methyl-accepting chemotaxis protein [Gammaproteobacteria bacterium]|nr:methyl-accepting chemotaxis protein [Gammaproteobacteria bacterium]
MFINKLSIRGRIFTLAISLIILMTGIVAYSLFAINRIGVEISAIADKDIPLTKALNTMNVSQLQQEIEFERNSREGENLGTSAGDEGRFKAGVKHFDDLSKGIYKKVSDSIKVVDGVIANTSDPKVAAEFGEIVQSLNKIETIHKSYAKKVLNIFSMYADGAFHKARRYSKKLKGDLKTLSTEIVGLMVRVERFSGESVARAEAQGGLTETVIAGLLLFSLVFGVLLAWIISHSTQGRLSEVAASLNLIADGDLSEDIGGDDEIAVPLRAMRDHLVEIVSQINLTTIELTTTTEEVSSVTSTTSTNIHDQQSETEQVAIAMNEMSATVQAVAENINNTYTAASRANEEAETGREVVDATVNGIQQLAGQIENSAEVIGNVADESENINTVLEVIKGIAEQTNLLALNAAIEAARAGEQGRGFAVVADEVRTLASRTQTSTTEINQMIEKLQSGAKLAVDVMNQSREQAKSVVDQASQAGDSLSTIAQSVSQINEMSSQIATAAEEQGAVAEDMGQNIARINEMTAENAVAAEKTAQSGHDMAKIAIRLQEFVGRFRMSGSLDIAAAKTAHRAWKSKLRRFLDGEDSIDEAEAVSHTDCVLGQWYYAGGAMDRYSHIPEISEIEVPHKEMHDLVHEVMELKLAGKEREAEETYAKIAPLSERIVSLLDRIEQQLA